MHASVMEWVRLKAHEHLRDDMKVLEVGSRNINGSVRRFFGPDYTGLDMEAGLGVDVVAKARQIPFPAATFDVVVCTEMLEHDPTPWISMAEMGRVLRPGGYLMLTTRGPEFPHHEYPSDYYRYTVDAIEVLVEEVAGLIALEIVPDPLPGHPGVFALAAKPRG